MRKLWLVLSLAFFSLPAVSQVCKSTQYDMLEWMLPTRAVQNSHFDVLYPSTGKFYWVKGALGFPWDEDEFDEKFIYQDKTENLWGQPTTYKAFETPRPWTPRCIDKPVQPGKLASITHDISATWYRIYSSCTSYTRHNLLYSINEVWGPSDTQVGTLPFAPTLTLSYRYGCDSQFSKCSQKETFELQHEAGLVRWTHYVAKNGGWAIVNQTTDTNVQEGTVTPVHPCWVN